MKITYDPPRNVKPPGNQAHPQTQVRSQPQDGSRIYTHGEYRCCEGLDNRTLSDFGRVGRCGQDEDRGDLLIFV